jgi:DNA-binding MarR family transcriptional regulator
MDIFHDYAFVVGGKKRKEVVKLLADPRTPTELAKILKVHPNVISRILKGLAARELVDSYNISGRKKTYILTKRGELARQILDNLIEPKTLSELLMHLRSHHKIAVAVIKHLIQHGFVTILKNINPTRKIIRLTQKGEAIREKLD